jgi:hypothetical protein
LAKEEYVTLIDMFGEEILPGHLICYASGSQMKAGIVADINQKPAKHQSYWGYNNHYPAGKIFVYYIGATTSSKIIGHVKPYPTATYTTPEFEQIKHEYLAKASLKIEEGPLQNRIMVLKNPFYHIDNPNVVKQLKIVDDRIGVSNT